MATTPTLTETDAALEYTGVFGVDTDGNLHRYDVARDRVVVTDRDRNVIKIDDDVSRDQIAGDGRTWESLVDDQIDGGWVDFWFHETNAGLFRLDDALAQLDDQDSEGEQ